MTLEGIEQEVLGGLILAIVLWCSGAIFQWAINRNRQITSLRKYERLRAKVEVLSKLAAVELSKFKDAELEQRQQEVLRCELASLLDELEQEEREATEVSQIAGLVGSLRFGPSRTLAAIASKLLHYAVAFVTLCVLSLFIILAVDPPTIDGKTEPVSILAGICISLPFLLLMSLTYYVALRIHRRQFVAAQVVSPRSNLRGSRRR